MGGPFVIRTLALTREEASLKHTQYQSERDEIDPFSHKPEADHGDAPEEGDGWEENERSNFSQDHGSRWLQQNVGDEEEEDDDRVSVSDKDEVDTHTSDNRNTSICSIHQGHAVKETERKHQPSVNTPDDLLLLCWGKSLDASIVDFIGVNGHLSLGSLELINVEILLGGGCVGVHLGL